MLGVCGSVAAYRAADLARELMRSGFTVRACLTDSAEKFVTRQLFEALTGQPCLVGAFDEPVQGRMAHIDWARQAEAIVIAPATANTLAKLAHGEGEDMLTTIALAFDGPIVIAPAMNPSMYAQPTTQAALHDLEARGAMIVEAAEGDVACGEQGQGKLASIERIAEAVLLVANRGSLLEGKRVLITSGPTQEPIDSVRYLSNRSSGKMGAALARAALLLGAKATVVSGPTSVPLPLRADLIRVRTAEQLLAEAAKFAPEADLIVGAAAVADYRPKSSHEGKRRRIADPWSLELVENPDVLAELAKLAKPGAKVIGFAAEPSAGLETAKQKIARKGLFAIAVNDVSRSDIGFESDQNELTLLFADGRTEHSGLRSKLSCALWLLEQAMSDGR